MNIDDRPTDDRPQGPFTHFWKISNGHNSATRQPIPFMFGSRVEFSGTADPTAPFPVGSNLRWRPAAILESSNGHISATRHPIDFVFGSRVGFSGTADPTAPFSVGSNSRWRPAAILEKFKRPYLSDILRRRSLIYNDGDSKLIS